MEFRIGNKQLGSVTVKISDEDMDLAVRPWHLAGGKASVGRYVCGSDGRYLHRVVAVRMGIIPSTVPSVQQGQWSVSIDHANGDKLDNRRENLRLRTRSQQCTNPNDALRSTNSSGHRGVNYCAARAHLGKPWRAYGCGKTLGWFATIEEAVEARRVWDAQRS